MRAEYKKDLGLYTIGDAPDLPKFTRFVASVGWLDPAGKQGFDRHWFVVLGDQEDKIITAMATGSGSLREIAEALTDWKDRLLIQVIYVDGTDLQSVRFLKGQPQGSGWDGLATYWDNGKDTFDRPQYINKPSKWPHFRNRDTKAYIQRVPDDIRVNVRAGIDILINLTKEDRFLILPEASTLNVLRADPPDQQVAHPLIQATVWALMMLERTRPGEAKPMKQSEPFYRNLEKEVRQ